MKYHFTTAVCSFETSWTTYSETHILQDRKPNLHRGENLKTREVRNTLQVFLTFSLGMRSALWFLANGLIYTPPEPFGTSCAK